MVRGRSSRPPSSPRSSRTGSGMEVAPSTSTERALPRMDSASLTRPRGTRYTNQGKVETKECSQVIFANAYTSVECQNPINWNFLLENPAVSFTNNTTIQQLKYSTPRIPPRRRSLATCHQGLYKLAATGNLIVNCRCSEMLFSPRYNLQLKVDGVEVSNNKAIEYRDQETPYLNAIVNK